MPKSGTSPVQLRTLAFAFMAVNDRVTELHIDDYISKYKSYDWWNDEEGTEITSRDFIQQLNEVKTPEVLVVINSGGGDATEGAAIANAIRDKRREGMVINCKILSLCASAAVDIACACEKVSIYRNAYMMIHEASAFLFDMYRSDDLQGIANMLSSMNGGVAENYAAKSEKTKEEVLKLMKETTWYSGQEAVDNGFADELLDESAETTVEPTAQQRYVMMNGAAVAAADFSKAPAALQALKNKKKPKEQKGYSEMKEIKNVSELKANYPELCKEMVDSELSDAISTERARMKALDGVSAKVPADMLAKAKYEEPRDAQAVVYQAVTEGKLVNQTVLGQLEEEAGAAGAVPGTANGGTGDGAEMSAVEQKKANAKALAASVSKTE